MTNRELMHKSRGVDAHAPPPAEMEGGPGEEGVGAAVMERVTYALS
jgi:hypothetical protein